MKTALTKKTTFLASLLVVAGAWTIQSCSGDDGSDGPAGAAGANCSVQQTGTGATVTCPGSAPVEIAGGGGCTQTPATNGTWLNCGGSPILIPSQGSGSIGDCQTETDTDLGTQVISIVCGSSRAQIGICGDIATGSDFVFYNPTVEQCGFDIGLGKYIVTEAIETCDNAPGTAAEKVYNKGKYFCQTDASTQTADAPRTGVRIMPRCNLSTDDGYYGTSSFCWAQSTSMLTTTPKCGGNTYDIGEFCVTATGKIYDRCGYTKPSDLNTTPYIDSRKYDPNDEFCQTKLVVTDSRVQPLCVDPDDISGNTKREYGLLGADEMCIGGKVNARCGTLSGYFNATNFFCDAPNSKTYARCDVTVNLGVFVPQTHFCYSPDYTLPEDYTNANQHNDVDHPDGGVVTVVCGKKFLDNPKATFPDERAFESGTLNPANDPSDANKRDPSIKDSLINVGYSVKQFCTPNSAIGAGTFVYNKCADKWAYNPEPGYQSCRTTDGITAVLESCGNGSINVNTQVCGSNSPVNTCGGVGGSRFGTGAGNSVLVYPSLDANGVPTGTPSSVAGNATQACIDGRVYDCNTSSEIPTLYFDGCKAACTGGTPFYVGGSCKNQSDADAWCLTQNSGNYPTWDNTLLSCKDSDGCVYPETDSGSGCQ